MSPTEPPARGVRKPRRLVISGPSSSGSSRRPPGPVATEDVTFRVVEAFERLGDPSRFVIDVSHIRGVEGLGCDLVSVASEEIRHRVQRDRRIDDQDIQRYIEVKGRSSRQAAVELEDSQLQKAEEVRGRYFVYRVFVDRKREGHFEVAVLRDPLHSKAVRLITRFDLAAGSGAEWFNVEEVELASDRSTAPMRDEGGAMEHEQGVPAPAAAEEEV